MASTHHVHRLHPGHALATDCVSIAFTDWIRRTTGTVPDLTITDNVSGHVIRFFVALQVEANRWKDRGKKLFTEKNYGVLVEYYTLAIKYAPSADKDFLATLLCNRALVHYNLSNYRAGLDDAKSCTRFRPSWFKVRTVKCYMKCCEQH